MSRRIGLAIVVVSVCLLAATAAKGFEVYQVARAYSVGFGIAQLTTTNTADTRTFALFNGTRPATWSLVGSAWEYEADDVVTRVGTYLGERSSSYCAQAKVVSRRYRYTTPNQTGSCGTVGGGSGYVNDSAEYQHIMNTCSWGNGGPDTGAQGYSIEISHDDGNYAEWMDGPDYQSGYPIFAYQTLIFSEVSSVPDSDQDYEYSCYRVRWGMTYDPQ